jgi:carboxypeptidase Taq
MTTAYDQLRDTFTRLSRLSHLSAITGWDMQTQMPSGGSQARAEALSELSVLMHQTLTAPQIADWIEQAKNESLDTDQQANLHEIARRYQQAVILPDQFVSAKSLAGMKCEHAWRTQRPENDWSGFVKNFAPVVELSREEAQIRAEATNVSRYDALLDLYEPGMTSARLDAIFADVKSWLPELLKNIIEKQSAEQTLSAQGPFAIEKQRALGLDIMQVLGFDFNHGRLDVSAHPFCGGVPEDVRITTRYTENDFLSALLGIVHETGHARYEQNLPKQWLDSRLARRVRRQFMNLKVCYLKCSSLVASLSSRFCVLTYKKRLAISLLLIQLISNASISAWKLAISVLMPTK